MFNKQTHMYKFKDKCFNLEFVGAIIPWISKEWKQNPDFQKFRFYPRWKQLARKQGLNNTSLEEDFFSLLEPLDENATSWYFAFSLVESWAENSAKMYQIPDPCKFCAKLVVISYAVMENSY